MSTDLFDLPGKLKLSRHVGPAKEGRDRRRWQLTLHPVDGVVVFTRHELTEFCQELLDVEADAIREERRA